MNLKTVDCETGGFDCEADALTQIAISVIDVDTLASVDRYQSYIKPYGKNYSPIALEKTRLSLEILDQQGLLNKVVAQQVVGFLKKHSPKTSKNFKDRSIFVGHNPLFDIGFVEVFLQEFAGDSLESFFRGKKFGKYWVPEHIDTASLARLMYSSRIADHKLGTVLEASDIELNDAHDAMNDVDGTEKYAILSIQKLRAKVTSSSTQQTEKKVGRRFRDTFQIA